MTEVLFVSVIVALLVDAYMWWLEGKKIQELIDATNRHSEILLNMKDKPVVTRLEV